MSEMRVMYQEVILDHNRKPRNYGRLEGANRHADGHNPLCGDSIHLTMNVEGDLIQAVAFEGEGCAICKASASMMTGVVKGLTVREAEELVSQFRGMTTGTLDMNGEHRLGRLKVFEGIKDLPSRVKCAILPWHTLTAAIHSVQSASTEGKDDPIQEG
ncbi:Fe-S cluster assembly sulfur transfer protein SufU [Ferrovum myxofaciens]|jgi:nitrogen fixation NifU-like protein|uniref:SUF system NifU family Fe-S cluster assembly protein n=1 Tax=Ferrovum myxofaciens TaxID=416213 RepID=A0A859AFA8_9PROT|nr:SUF system NifU family Fe-S cluster assembly protein [Ferrovum myxofaciens]KXW57766.1 zinc-dependent sulfurtransferase SufU [Ferrovum myxofaciens]MBU6995650.1 SUF system NifU family Fe-S cluster assembly protein [Ferrovum myxofaciens]QKE39571.1 MAG: SUF system NifU family Fe-S cluster assembly protein [Ferrovum myxofaciens]QKE42168.1 MAG: SUF system NifU family Fe-S cluster assembly protein [Ferrovum myxofaciens]QWY74855.1 MAG: SUF system NifU family Fe-S cluster assembly protein [Ferrovum 